MIRTLFLSIVILLTSLCPASAQDRIKSMPGYDQYQSMRRSIPSSVNVGSLNVTWSDDGQSFEYRKGNKPVSYTHLTLPTNREV